MMNPENFKDATWEEAVEKFPKGTFLWVEKTKQIIAEVRKATEEEIESSKYNHKNF